MAVELHDSDARNSVFGRCKYRVGPFHCAVAPSNCACRRASCAWGASNCMRRRAAHPVPPARHIAHRRNCAVPRSNYRVEPWKQRDIKPPSRRVALLRTSSPSPRTLSPAAVSRGARWASTEWTRHGVVLTAVTIGAGDHFPCCRVEPSVRLPRRGQPRFLPVDAPSNRQIAGRQIVRSFDRRSSGRWGVGTGKVVAFANSRENLQTRRRLGCTAAYKEMSNDPRNGDGTRRHDGFDDRPSQYGLVHDPRPPIRGRGRRRRCGG